MTMITNERLVNAFSGKARQIVGGVFVCAFLVACGSESSSSAPDAPEQGVVGETTDSVMDSAGSLMDEAADAAADAADAVQEQAGDALDSAQEAAGEALDDAQDAAGDLMDDVSDAASELGGDAEEEVGNALDSLNN